MQSLPKHAILLSIALLIILGIHLAISGQTPGSEISISRDEPARGARPLPAPDVDNYL